MDSPQKMIVDVHLEHSNKQTTKILEQI